MWQLPCGAHTQLHPWVRWNLLKPPSSWKKKRWLVEAEERERNQVVQHLQQLWLTPIKVSMSTLIRHIKRNPHRASLLKKTSASKAKSLRTGRILACLQLWKGLPWTKYQVRNGTITVRESFVHAWLDEKVNPISHVRCSFDPAK